MSGAAATQLDLVNRWVVKHKLALPDAQLVAEARVFDALPDVLQRIAASRPTLRTLQPAQRDDVIQEASFQILLALRSCRFSFASWRYLTNCLLLIAQGSWRARRPQSIGELIGAIAAPQHEEPEPDQDQEYTQRDVERTKEKIRSVLEAQPVRREIFNGLCQGRSLSMIAETLPRPFRDCRCAVLDKDSQRVNVEWKDAYRYRLSSRTSVRRHDELPDAAVHSPCSGELVFYPEQVELCGVSICMGPQGALARAILDALCEPDTDGSYRTLSDAELASQTEAKGGKKAVQKAIGQLRQSMKRALPEAPGGQDVLFAVIEKGRRRASLEPAELRRVRAEEEQGVATLPGVFDQWEQVRRELRQLEPNPFLLDHAILDVALECRAQMPGLNAEPPPDEQRKPGTNEPGLRKKILAKAQLLGGVLDKATKRPEMQGVALCLAACLLPDQTEQVLEFHAGSSPSFQKVIDDLAREIGDVSREFRNAGPEQGMPENEGQAGPEASDRE